MKAAVLVSPARIADRPLTITEVSAPELKPGHVLLKVEACGLCRTDLHIVEGEFPPRIQNLIPGHQIVGRVASGETSEFPLGVRVGVSWVGGVDGQCGYCQKGLRSEEH